MTTGKRIQEARKKANLTQKELGEKLGVSSSMIGQYENDLRNPKLGTLKKIAEALSIDMAALMGWPDGTIKIMTEVEEKEILAEVSDTLKTLILLDFDKLNAEGQQKALERVEELTEIPKYQK